MVEIRGNKTYAWWVIYNSNENTLICYFESLTFPTLSVVNVNPLRPTTDLQHPLTWANIITYKLSFNRATFSVTHSLHSCSDVVLSQKQNLKRAVSHPTLQSDDQWISQSPGTPCCIHSPKHTQGYVAVVPASGPLGVTSVQGEVSLTQGLLGKVEMKQ